MHISSLALLPLQISPILQNSLFFAIVVLLPVCFVCIVRYPFEVLCHMYREVGGASALVSALWGRQVWYPSHYVCIQVIWEEKRCWAQTTTYLWGKTSLVGSKQQNCAANGGKIALEQNNYGIKRKKYVSWIYNLTFYITSTTHSDLFIQKHLCILTYAFERYAMLRPIHSKIAFIALNSTEALLRSVFLSPRVTLPRDSFYNFEALFNIEDLTLTFHGGLTDFGLENAKIADVMYSAIRVHGFVTKKITKKQQMNLATKISQRRSWKSEAISAVK